MTICDGHLAWIWVDLSYKQDNVMFNDVSIWNSSLCEWFESIPISETFYYSSFSKNEISFWVPSNDFKI